MRKKAKAYDVFMRIRGALRLIHSRSPMRREAIKKVTVENEEGVKVFVCVKCNKQWPVQMADLDHEPPLGALTSFFGEAGVGDLASWAHNLFYGPVQVICKLCHRKKTTAQRKERKPA